YHTDVSFHQIRPSESLGLKQRTYLGWSQRLRWGGFRVSQDLQVDRSSSTGDWKITQLLVRASVPITEGLDLNTRYSLRQPSPLTPLDSLLPDRRDQATVGLAYWVAGAMLGGDVTATRLEGRDIAYTYSASFNIPRSVVLDLGISASASYWTREDARTLYLSGGISRAFGLIQARAFYHRYRTERGQDDLLTNTGEAAINFPITRRVYSSVQARIQRGENLSSKSLNAGLWMTF
ncbi:MAG: hypothetical protein V3U63_06075, partial [Gemmatimonadota bacterium]